MTGAAIVGVGEARVYYVTIRDASGAEHDVPVDEPTYDAFKSLISVASTPDDSDWIGAIQANTSLQDAAQPLEAMPVDLAAKLSSIGLFADSIDVPREEEQDRGEVFRDDDDEEIPSL